MTVFLFDALTRRLNLEKHPKILCGLQHALI